MTGAKLLKKFDQNFCLVKKKVPVIYENEFSPGNDEIKKLIDNILYTSKVKHKQPISVRGIWKNKGFENLDIEKELKTLRREIKSNLDRKELY